MAKLGLTLLGGFQARLDTGETLGLPTRKAQALPAYLALPPGQAHPRDKLAALLWGGIREESARASLRQALFSIRKALGDAERDVLRQEGDALSLVPGAIEVDAVLFQQHVAEGTAASLEQAATVYRGDLLSGFVVDESPFEEWLLGERERLRELALEGLARLLAQQRRAGSAEAAVQTALRLLTLDPLQEAVHRALMHLYADLGRRGTALRQYQQCVAVLSRELGIEPEAETKTLYQEILRQRAPSRRALDPSIVTEPVVASRTAPAEIPLIGRAGELKQLLAALERARAGRGVVVAVLGEAGIGKTRLVGELIGASEAHSARVLVGRCFESEQVLPFGPWVDASRAAPAILEALKSSPDSLEVFERVAAAIGDLARDRPLLVVLEDVHWADEMSLRLLAFLGRRLPALRVLIAVTTREEELADAVMLRRVLGELQHQQMSSLTLEPLTRDDTLALVQTLARAGSDATALARLGEIAWRASGGNPFVVVETVRSQVHGAGMPEPVRQLVAGRLERLSERARQLTMVAAVIGREFDFELLRQASGVDEAEAAAGVEELVRRRVLQGVGERFDFTHDRIRDVVLDGLLAPRRRVLHRAVAEAIATVHRDDLDAHVLALGLHYHGAEAWPAALTHLRQAAARAFAQSAYREAAACFERALEAAAHLPPSPAMLDQMLDMRLQLRTALWPLAEFERIAECLAEAERLAVTLDDRPRLGRVTAYLSVLRWIIGDFRTALGLGQQARSSAVSLDDGLLRAMSNYYVGLAHLLLGEYDESRAAFQENVPTLDVAKESYVLGAPRSHLVQAAAWIVLPLAELGDFRAGLAHGRVALELAEAAQDVFGIVTATYGLAYLHCQRGEVDQAIPLLERGMALCREREFSVWLPQHTGYLGYAYARAGRIDEGLALLERAFEVYEVTRAWPFRALLTAHRGAACLRAGRTAAALALGREALALARQHGERGHEAWALRLLGEIAGRPETSDAREAERCYREAATLAGELGMRPLLARCRLELGTLLARAGSSARAREHLTAAATLYRELQMDAARAEAEAALA